MEKKQYLFFITQSGDRTNIMSDFKVIELPEMLNYLSEKTKWGNMVRYAYVGGTAQRLSLMKLEEFDEVFEGSSMSEKQLREFREEIRMKYGEQPVSKGDVKRGDVLREGSGHESVFLDRIELTQHHPEVKNRHWSYANKPAWTEVITGYGWLGYYGVEVTKSFPKRFKTSKSFYDADYKHQTVSEIKDGMELERFGVKQIVKFL